VNLLLIVRVTNDKLYSQEQPLAYQAPQRLLVIGEVLWDIFEDGTLLGGAPLNFAAHASRLGHRSILVSVSGDDNLGKRARQQIFRGLSG
jgi:fructokinase